MILQEKLQNISSFHRVAEPGLPFLVEQYCGSGSKLDLYSATLWIRSYTGKIRINWRQKVQY